MPSDFDQSFMDNDVIEVSHVKQYAGPVRDLESGKAFYRNAAGDGSPYTVNFTKDPDPDVYKHYIATTAHDPDNDLEAGQVVVFKANVSNTNGAASLQLKLEDGSSGSDTTPIPLHVGDTPVGVGEILQDQIVVAIYNDTSTPRFDVISLGSAGGGSNASDIADDSGVTSPAGTVADALSQLDGAVGANLTSINTNAGNISTNTSNINANYTALSGKQDQAGVLDDIAGLDESPADLAQGDILVHDGTNMQKLPSGSDGQILSANSMAGNGLGVEWSTPMGTGAVDSVFGRTGDVVAASGDYDANQVDFTPAGGVAATDVQAAIEELDTEIGANATAISGKQDQDAALDEISGLSMSKGDILVHDGTSIQNLGAGSDGQLLQTNPTAISGVEWANPGLSQLADVDLPNTLADGQMLQYNSGNSQFENVSRSISTTGPLTGGGDLSQDRTISMPAADGSGQDGYLTSAKFAEFDGKQEQAAVLDDISSLDESPSDLVKGDMLVHDGTNMQKLPSGSDGQILSANAAAGNGLGVEWSTPMGTGAVDSVFGRTGDVVAASGDYDANQVDFTPAGGVAATDVQAAIEELDAEIGANATAISGKQDQDAALDDISALSLASGDILYVDNSNSISRLPKGSDDQVLTLANGLPSWAASSGGANSVDIPALWVTSNDTSTNLNSNNVAVQWDQTAQVSGSGISHTTSSPTRISFDESGLYRIEAHLSINSTQVGVDRPNIRVRFRKNGTTLIGSVGATGYLRKQDDGTPENHDHSSIHLVAMIDASPNDYVEVISNPEAENDVVNLVAGESILIAHAMQPVSVDVSTLSITGIAAVEGQTVQYQSGNWVAVDAISDGGVPIGSVMSYAGSSAPSGWLLMYGQAISRTTYADLFAVLGTTYGSGDGSTTFNLPDLRGRVVAGKDNMGGSSSNRLTSPINGDNLGNSGGSQSHTLTTSEMPSHSHVVNDPGHSHVSYWDQTLGPGSGNPRVPYSDYRGGLSNYRYSVTNTSWTGIGLYSAGGSQSHNNVQPTFILNSIIYAGV